MHFLKSDPARAPQDPSISISLVIASAVIGLALVAPGLCQQASGNSTPSNIRVNRLERQVEVLRDRWGMNHIYARNEHDLFFMQGYCAARDRLFQMELWRRRATGTAAEVFGRKELKRDIAARLFTFRGDVDADLSWYHPHGALIVSAFVDGVNTYIDHVLNNPEELPIEFKLLGIRPVHWTNAVVIARNAGVFGSIYVQLNTAIAVHVMGAEKVKRLSRLYGHQPSLDIDPSIDLSLLNENILELYQAFRTPMRFSPEQVAEQYRSTTGALQARTRDDRPGEPGDAGYPTEGIGSNNWVISGKVTSTGKPMLVNDPHRAEEVPSLRYWVHLVAPGWNVIGGGEPVSPGVAIGHNEYGAWGLTIFGTQTEDLYVYDTNPSNPNQYKYRGKWEDMKIIHDSIPVKGEPPAAVDLKFTRHGPVLYEDTEHHKAYADRAAWLDTGTAPYLASLRMDQATNWTEFRAACKYNRIPSENMIWADTGGNIGYQAAAVTPIRRNWTGLVPVPGDGRYEWDGYLPVFELPHSFNPQKGFWVTANNYQFPPDYPHPEAEHHLAADPFRADRITEFLTSGRLHTLSDMMQLQNDELSVPARSIVPLLRDVPISDPNVSRARDALLSWDYVLDKNSAAAGIYEMFQRRLLANAAAVLLPKEIRNSFELFNIKSVIDLLNVPGGEFGPDPIAERDKLLTASLEQAVSELTQKLGPNPQDWEYGQMKYHHILIRHPLSAAVNPEMRKLLDVGPASRGGDNYTVNVAGGGDNQTFGASLKMIADLNDWDSSVAQNNPGQSGDSRSPHYHDLFDLWRRGKYFPIFYSRSRIDSVLEQETIFLPSARNSATR